ncbi:MAG TPA: hypothetical protein VHV47_15200 [Opitutaceae bacterium]|nr:hypothetical protein [Opitutaceae bacterium]
MLDALLEKDLLPDWLIRLGIRRLREESARYDASASAYAADLALAAAYGADQARKWWACWRVFYLSCEELWGYRGGEEWIVSHYLFAPRRTSADT